MVEEVQNFRIEPFGSSNYFFNDILLRNKQDTLTYLKSREDSKKFLDDIQKIWDNGTTVSLLNLRLPFILQLEYTYKCPLKCRYCYSSSGPKRKETISPKKFKELTDKITKEEIFDVYILGGEPFAEVEYLKYFLSKVTKKYITISTNGVLIKEEYLDWIKKSKNRVIISMGVDGPNSKIHDSTRGGFKEMYQSLKMLNKHEIPLIATTCVTRSNHNHLEELINFLIDNNVRAIQLLPVETCHLTKEIRDYIEVPKNSEVLREDIGELVEKNEDKITFDISFKIPGRKVKEGGGTIPYGPCTAGITSAGININGNLVLCPPVQALEEKIDTIGNAFQKLKKRIWKKRDISLEKSQLSIEQDCKVYGYGDKCPYNAR